VTADVGNATQLITVAAPSPSSTDGTLTAWERTGGTWQRRFGPVHAYLGSEGIGTSSEQHSRTPQGTFTLTQSFGRNADPGTALPYFRTDRQDWWVSDVGASSYNTHQRCAAASCSFDTAASEQLNLVDPEYDYAVVIDANMNPVVPGAGSAFFLHVANGGPTAGCVAIEQDTLVAIMQWLDPAHHPRIAIGLG
jgi:L,D-peptidoglycan transpeptidase YkuD (ErfK/YbiS/YcfS/YnhG family)